MRKPALFIAMHRVYKSIWTPVLGKELNLIAEVGNGVEYAAAPSNTTAYRDQRIAIPTSMPSPMTQHLLLFESKTMHR